MTRVPGSDKTTPKAPTEAAPGAKRPQADRKPEAEAKPAAADGTASAKVLPSKRPLVIPAVKASPAPGVSTTSTSMAGTR